MNKRKFLIILFSTYVVINILFSYVFALPNAPLISLDGKFQNPFLPELKDIINYIIFINVLGFSFFLIVHLFIKQKSNNVLILFPSMNLLIGLLFLVLLNLFTGLFSREILNSFLLIAISYSLATFVIIRSFYPDIFLKKSS